PVVLSGQGAAGNALAAALEAVRAGADLVSCAVYAIALTLHRVSGEALATSLAGLGQDAGVDADALWHASELVDEHLGDEPVTPMAPRIAVRAAAHRARPGPGPVADTRLRAGAECVDGRLRDEPVTPMAPRIAVRAAAHRVPPGLVAALDTHLRAQAAGDRLEGGRARGPR